MAGNFSGMEDRIRKTIIKKLCDVTGEKIDERCVRVQAGESYVAIDFRDNAWFDAFNAARATVKTMSEMGIQADGPHRYKHEQCVKMHMVSSPEDVEAKLGGRIYERHLNKALPGSQVSLSR